MNISNKEEFFLKNNLLFMKNIYNYIHEKKYIKI